MMLIVGLSISAIAFVCELRQVADSRSMRELFRDIQRKREEWELSERKGKHRGEAFAEQFVDLNNDNIDLFVVGSARRSASSLEIRHDAFLRQ